MISQLLQLNWLAFTLAFFVYFILGALWFTLFFSKQYKISLGRNPKELLPNDIIYIVGPAICSLIVTITTAILYSALNIQSFYATLEFSMIVGLGYLVTNTVNIAINPNMPRPFYYSIITGTYHLIGIHLVCFILFALK